MGDASECVPATLMRQNARASTPPRASQAPEQNNTLQNPRVLARRWQQSIFDNAGHDMQLLMMCTRAAFYATEPSNAAANAPVEACGAHGPIAHVHVGFTCSITDHHGAGASCTRTVHCRPTASGWREPPAAHEADASARRVPPRREVKRAHHCTRFDALWSATRRRSADKDVEEIRRAITGRCAAWPGRCPSEPFCHT